MPIAPAPRRRRTGAPADWAADGQPASLHPRSAVEVLTGLSDKVSHGAVAEYQPIPLGLSPLDRTLGGGIRSGELMLIGGAQGTGKTTMALQIARNIAQSGQANVLYICFEHDEEYLLNRLMAMESALAGPMPPDTTRASRSRTCAARCSARGWPRAARTSADLRANPRLRPALERIGRYGQGLFLLRGSHAHTTAPNLRTLIEGYRRAAPAPAAGRLHRLPAARAGRARPAD